MFSETGPTKVKMKPNQEKIIMPWHPTNGMIGTDGHQFYSGEQIRLREAGLNSQ